MLQAKDSQYCDELKLRQDEAKQLHVELRNMEIQFGVKNLEIQRLQV